MGCGAGVVQHEEAHGAKIVPQRRGVSALCPRSVRSKRVWEGKLAMNPFGGAPPHTYPPSPHGTIHTKQNTRRKMKPFQ